MRYLAIIQAKKARIEHEVAIKVDQMASLANGGP
jgi:hypothetical protein